jgi:hypothetical protein
MTFIFLREANCNSPFTRPACPTLKLTIDHVTRFHIRRAAMDY